MSHPSRVRGLKLKIPYESKSFHAVAPFTGAWIEITVPGEGRPALTVAPFTGAWIEISPPSPHLVVGDGRTLHGCVD